MAKMNQLKKMARELNVKNHGRMDKRELIWEIQKAEGHSDCFSRIPDCGQDDCLFRSDCLPAQA